MNHPKVTVLGSANVDLVIRAERMPNKGETRIGEAFDIFTGGKGFNQATAAARLGAEVTFIGRIGDDPFADILRSAIGAEHIRQPICQNRCRKRNRCRNDSCRTGWREQHNRCPTRQYAPHIKRYRRRSR